MQRVRKDRVSSVNTRNREDLVRCLRVFVCRWHIISQVVMGQTLVPNDAGAVESVRGRGESLPMWPLFGT